MYAGGIQNEEQAAEIIRADRALYRDTLLHSDLKEVKKIAMRLGGQAIVGSMPVKVDTNGKVGWYNYHTGQDFLLNDDIKILINEGFISEILLIDFKNNGYDGAFDFRTLDIFKNFDVPLILFVGLSTDIVLKKALDMKEVAAQQLATV